MSIKIIKNFGFTLLELLVVMVIIGLLVSYVEQGLVALNAKPADEAKWAGPYLKKAVPPDPWGHAYVYKAPGDWQ